MTHPEVPARQPLRPCSSGRRRATLRTVVDPHGLAYLHARLALVEARVRAAVARRRCGDPNPEDPFRGLYLSDGDIDRLLATAPPPPMPPDGEAVRAAAEAEAAADAAEAQGADVRLRRLSRFFDLDEADEELFLVALAPDLDVRFEPLYGYLHDDVTRRRASTGLALALCWPAGAGAGARGRLGPAGRLVAGRLLVVEDEDRPFLSRPIRIPDRVTAHLLGEDVPDVEAAGLLTRFVEADVGDLDLLARAIESTRLVYVRETVGGAGCSYAGTALASAARPVVALDLARLASDDQPRAVAAVVAREARLSGAVLVAGPLEALADRGPAAVRAFAEARCPVVLVGSRGWDPAWSREVPLVVEAPELTVDQRDRIWRTALASDLRPELDPAAATIQFRLTPEQVERAARAARLQASAAGRRPTAEDLRAGARAQNASGLERLARSIEPGIRWSDLVLPAEVIDQLRELTARVRRRDRVLDEWGMGRGSSTGRGITALFAGESGTGKTISAEVVAADLGLQLYVIDLSTVIDKYIGETEKNLDRIFLEADRLNGVLLFDEADAIFGKRSDIKDAHDRYANVEVAYLLQRMEQFNGLAVLTTNLRANVDEAFTRRLDLVVDFPMPEEHDRRRLWVLHLRSGVPRSDDIDFDFLSRSFKLSGGNIRNIVLSAAYMAADDDRPVTMADLIRATEREYRKLGHLCLEAEFGPFFGLVGRRTG